MATLQEKLQKMANDSAIQVQKLVNSANKMTLDFNKSEASTARWFNQNEAQKARDFEKMMSDTSHQREVADLKKAGLNPVLSVNSGANSYSSASANANNASASFDSGANSVSGLYGSLMSGLVGLQQSQMSTSAQLQAAKLSADATRFAAEQSASAQKYSADMAYKTQMDKPQSSPYGILDKYAKKLVDKFAGKVSKNDLAECFRIGDAYNKKYSYKKDKHTFYQYDKKYINPMAKQIDSGLNKIGYNQYYINHLSDKQKYQLRLRFLEAFSERNTSAINSLIRKK